MFSIGRRYYHSLGNNGVFRRNLATHSSNSEMYWELSLVSTTANRDLIILLQCSCSDVENFANVQKGLLCGRYLEGGSNADRKKYV